MSGWYFPCFVSHCDSIVQEGSEFTRAGRAGIFSLNSQLFCHFPQSASHLRICCKSQELRKPALNDSQQNLRLHLAMSARQDSDSDVAKHKKKKKSAKVWVMASNYSSSRSNGVPSGYLT